MEDPFVVSPDQGCIILKIAELQNQLYNSDYRESPTKHNQEYDRKRSVNLRIIIQGVVFFIHFRMDRKQGLNTAARQLAKTMPRQGRS